jgi:hypothetical protein
MREAMKLLYVFALLGGMAAGQAMSGLTKGTIILGPPSTPLTIMPRDCENQISFRGSTKTVKELFPEECIPKGAKSWSECHDTDKVANNFGGKISCLCKAFDGGPPNCLCVPGGQACPSLDEYLAVPAGELLEVNPTGTAPNATLARAPFVEPAIQENVTTDKPGKRLMDIADADAFPCAEGQHYEQVEGFENLWECRGTHITGTKWSCSDKSSVLLESVDGKQHWCVKF